VDLTIDNGGILGVLYLHIIYFIYLYLFGFVQKWRIDPTLRPWENGDNDLVGKKNHQKSSQRDKLFKVWVPCIITTCF
jgi:hypothetical protein